MRFSFGFRLHIVSLVFKESVTGMLLRTKRDKYIVDKIVGNLYIAAVPRHALRNCQVQLGAFVNTATNVGYPCTRCSLK